MVESADGTPISYEVRGSGEPTLVFIHGWSCDARYWRAQVPHFSEQYRTVVIDLAGHGHSGLSRQEYTMAAFGEDVHAVIKELGIEQAILIGHSMGGPVSVAAAGLMPERVIGIIGVDTFQDVGETMTREQIEAWMAPMREDFRRGASEFVPQMFIESTDADLRDWIVADMTAAPPAVAVSALHHTLDDVVTGDGLARLAALEVPVVAINADIWPTNVESNRENIANFELVLVEGTDHFLHMAEPERFNRKLEQVISGMAR